MYVQSGLVAPSAVFCVMVPTGGQTTSLVTKLEACPSACDDRGVRTTANLKLVATWHESEAGDAVADHDNSDQEQNQNHDRHIVLHQPLA